MNLIIAASTRYTSPATATPRQAYGSIAVGSVPSGASAFTAAYPPRNANEEPKNAGTLNFVIKWNNKVPRPAISRVVEISSPVMIGTRIVAPNIANICWIPKITIFGFPSVLAS